MKEYLENAIHNIAVLGHLQSGKSTLCRNLLQASDPSLKTLPSNISDFEPEELERNCSLLTTLISLEHNGHKINLLDTPGDADLEHEIREALQPCESAILVISAQDKIQVGTELALDLLNEYSLPYMIVISKIDKDRAEFDQILGPLKEICAKDLIILGAPDNVGPEFTYVNPKIKSSDQMEQAQLESIITCDDEVLERYIAGDLPSKEDLENLLNKALFEKKLSAVTATGAKSDQSYKFLLDNLISLMPNATKWNFPYSEGSLSDESTTLFAFKIRSDQYVGKLTFVRIVSGELRPDTAFINVSSQVEEKPHQIETFRGKEAILLLCAHKGDLVGLPKLQSAKTFDLFITKGAPIPQIKLLQFPVGLTKAAIVPKDASDDDKLMVSLNRLMEEDPAIRIERVNETHQSIVYAAGETHLHLIIERLKRRFNVSVNIEPVIAPYRETITSTAKAQGKHKKQTGGHGQFGIVDIVIEPLPRAKGFEFVDQIFGGAIPKQYIPAVEKGLLEQMQEGVIWGYPLTDIKVTLVDGKYHPVDSSELSFKLAAALALREAVPKASPCLLEPISKVTLKVPANKQGDILGDLNSKRAKVLNTEILDNSKLSLIEAYVPTSELSHFGAQLKSLTANKGRASVVHDHYDILPAHLAEKIPKLHEK